MRITSIESRIIGYDVAEAWLPEGPPEGIASTWYRYSLRHVPHRRGHRRLHDAELERRPTAREMADVLHVGVRARSCIGEDPMQHRAPVAQAAAPEPARLQPVGRRRRLDRRRALGHRRQGRRTSRSRSCSGSPATKVPALRDGVEPRTPRPRRSSRRRSASRPRATTASRSSSGTAWTGTSRGSAPRARPSATTTR